MGALRLDRFVNFLTSIELLVGVLWLGLAVLTITLLVLARTRWGQAQPLRKCVVLSLLAHILLAGYATTVQIVASRPAGRKEPLIRVSIVDGDSPREYDTADVQKSKPWDSFAEQSVVEPDSGELFREELPEIRQPQRRAGSKRSGLPADAALESVALANPVQPNPGALPAEEASNARLSTGRSAEPIEAPAARRREAPQSGPPDMPPVAQRPYVDAPISRPVRDRTSGLPSALLERPLPTPKLADLSTTPEPEWALDAETDVPSRLSHGKPAELSSPSPKLDSAPRSALGDSQAPPLRKNDNATTPSTTARASQQRSDSQGSDSPLQNSPDHGPSVVPVNRPTRAEDRIPAIYSLRTAPDRLRAAQRRGATPESEAAVEAALQWLADNQEPDGHWNARMSGAGRELLVSGRDREGAGIQADTGITALALLAMLASGHTHEDGIYSSKVRRGLQYLLDSQGRDGNLGGRAGTYAFMYCHAMALFALGEAYGMTGDQRLREPVRRAVAFTLSAQDPSGGGWRYSPHDPGDTSQLGWQLMALKSAELAGIEIPERVVRGMLAYLASVSSGEHGGLAAYRPSEVPSRTMTAEALACHQFLGMSRGDPAGQEAADHLLGELPGMTKANLYYWYYGTLAMYQFEGNRWQQWNSALQAELVASQRKSGALGGSWDPDTVWGGYGGRVYSTAVAALCLEVYYRFLPLYVNTAARDQRLR